ncbi:hypothetical protein BaRGS_00025610 [Batillaria attramentaria]|uniref:Uncharacterized protein n=1 Tax=Batillaria attramentaria TaxID=370345 RepID=A0ABD0K6Z7_9CAEN
MLLSFIAKTAELTYTNGVEVEEKEASLCDEDWSFTCDEARTECIDPSLTCNGVSECRNGRDESVEQCGEYDVSIIYASFCDVTRHDLLVDSLFHDKGG